jgi:hypothetical protein
VTLEEYQAWAVRVFGSVAAHERALPNRYWIERERGATGWYSVPRTTSLPDCVVMQEAMRGG